MKGMLIKDFRLLKNQGKTLLLMLLIVAIFMNFITDVGPSFIVGYITIIFSLLRRRRSAMMNLTTAIFFL